MSPSSLVCCWTWGVCPLFLFVCRLRSTINLPVRHIHAGCALYRSIVNIVEVEYRRTSIYTQNVIKKKKWGTVVYVEGDQRPIHAGPEKAIHYFKSWSVSELLISFYNCNISFVLFECIFWIAALFRQTTSHLIPPCLSAVVCPFTLSALFVHTSYLPLLPMGYIRQLHFSCCQTRCQSFFWVLHE